MRRIAYTLRAMLSPVSVIGLVLVTVLRTCTSYPFLAGGTLAQLIQVLYGGVEWDQFITLRQIAYWIMFLLPTLFGLTEYLSLSMGYQIRSTLHRNGSLRRWWFNETLSLVCYVYLMTAMAVALSLLIGILFGMKHLEMKIIDSTGFYQVSYTRWLLAPIMAGSVVLLCSLCYEVSYLIFHDMRISTFLYLVPPIISLLRNSNEERVLPFSSVFNWGMVSRYSLLAENGLSEAGAICRFALVVIALMIFGVLIVKWSKPSERSIK